MILKTHNAQWNEHNYTSYRFGNGTDEGGGFWLGNGSDQGGG